MNFFTGIKNISVWDTVFSIWLSSLLLGEGLGQFRFSLSTTMELSPPWSPQLWIFLHRSFHGDRFAFPMVSIWLPLRVANITDFSVEVRNLENDPYFSRLLYKVLKFSDFLWILQFFMYFSTFFIVIGNDHRFWQCSSWTANSDKKYMELNGAALNVNKPCATFRKKNSVFER